MNKFRIEEHDGYQFIHNEDGKTLGLASGSKVEILVEDGYAFKDLNQNGVLDPYEDWRLPIEARIDDLVKRMSVEEIAGLMLYSGHQALSSKDDMFTNMFAGTYDGLSLQEAGVAVSALTDQQKAFLENDNLRHILITTVDSAQDAAQWNNNVQAFVESLGLGIPVNTSTDPRHTPSGDSEFNAGAGEDISKWPEPLGLAASFDPELVERFGDIAAKEYRAMGIATALSPQIDIATDPRWMRFNGTFGEDSKLSTDLAKAYIDGFQTSYDKQGWGDTSVNAMVKHWPGGGSGEAGRDAHYGFGKFAVYPGNNLDEHLLPFTEGAFKLEGGTKKAAAVMPYYTISYKQDHVYDENMGNSYSKYIVEDLLRSKYRYDGVVCTDWMITGDADRIDSFLVGKSWGVDELSVDERHYKILMAGVDQFGGNNDLDPVMNAYNMGVQEHGETWMRQRFELSAGRLLNNIFRVGLFENPYLEPQKTQDLVGNPEFMEEGYLAQVKSIVMLKNKEQAMPIKERLNVYIPRRKIKEQIDWFGNVIPERDVDPVSTEIVDKYYNLVHSPEEADFALCFIESPENQPYSTEEGFLPISLQYRPYTAETAREVAIAEDVDEKRSYKGKTNVSSNEYDLDLILNARELMNDKPVIVVAEAKNPFVVAEFENLVDGILVHFNTQAQAIFDLISGVHAPSALLPFQMPANMETVEAQFEDVAGDMEVHVDSENHAYDFAFGLDFDGVIEDERTARYKRGK